MANGENELVILIHGTFAGPEKGKVKWWQVDSDPWKEIQKRLPADAQLANNTDVFHWSGENQERDRYEHGIKLLERLLKLEKQGRPYHLVGHSHGGSVIWHALQEAVRRRIGKKRPDPRLQLSHLCSWTTIGTPFMQFNETLMGRWPGALLTKFIFLVSWGITGYLAYRFISFSMTHISKADHGDSTLLYSAVAITVAVALAVLLGMPWHMYLSAIRLEALAMRQTALVRNQAMLEYGDRWLGLWSKEDEAIGGLKGSIRLQVQLLPRLQFLPSKVFLYDRRIWTYQFILRWTLAWLLNGLMIPVGNKWILGKVSKIAQGDDRPGCQVTSVSEGPICLGGTYQYPTLPGNIDAALAQSANDRLIAKAPDFIPKIRTLLADYSSGVSMLGGGIKAAGFEFAGDELIHTSYFSHPGVLDLLAHHIHVHGTHGKTDAHRRSDALGKWYRDARQSVKANVTESPVVQRRRMTYLGKRNRLALAAVALGVAGLWLSVNDGRMEIASIACGVAVLALVLGRIAQRHAERGARLRRTANLGVNLALLWFAILAFVPVVEGVEDAIDWYKRNFKPAIAAPAASVNAPGVGELGVGELGVGELGVGKPADIADLESFSELDPVVLSEGAEPGK